LKYDAFCCAAMMKQSEINPIDRHVGARVRMRRLMLHMSQSRLAEALSITFQQVQKYEKGTNRVSASRLAQIAAFLDVPIAFFFEGLPSSAGTSKDAAEPWTSEITVFLSTMDGIRLSGAFRGIRERKLRRSIVELVDAIAGHGG
jgi:transcriptional regulator with XRE-family HTH domain